MFLSIIIPVYNTEDFLNRCLDSIVAQRKKVNFSFEVIIINDGSIDCTDEILETYSEKYKFFKVFHTENKGVSKARNLGIVKSSGKYITFCDSDDCYEDDVLEKISETLMKFDSDFLIYGRKDILSNKVFSYHDSSKVGLLSHTPKEYLDDFFYLGKHTFSVCNKVYKRKIILDGNVTFNADLQLSEDTMFNLEYIRNISNIAIDYRVAYLRYYRKGSTIQKKINDFYFDNVKFIEKYMTKYKDDDFTEDSLALMYYFYGKVSIHRICDLIDGDGFIHRINLISKILKSVNFKQGLDLMKRKKVTKRERVFYYFSKYQCSYLIYTVFGILPRTKRKILNVKRLMVGS